MRANSGDTVAVVDLRDIPQEFERAEIRLEGLKPPIESFELRVFAGEPSANATTPTSGNAHYLGSQYFYGLGLAPDSTDRSSQMQPTQIRLNITDRFRAFLTAFGQQKVSLSLVALDRSGNEIPHPDLQFEGISIVTS